VDPSQLFREALSNGKKPSYREFDLPLSAAEGRDLVKTRPAVLAGVWILSALYAGLFLDRGWVPHDEGMLGQNAERVLRGELPHRDFDESYTGGLNYAHAFAFRIFGVNLLSSRVVLLVGFLAFVPALFAIALRFLPLLGAGLLTLLSVAWSVPNYSASMPSWYVLFFATWGTLFLLRELDTGRKRWLLAAGACGGVSLLVIVVGLYIIAAALLYLAFREQVAAERGNFPRGRVSSAFPLFLTICCVGFAALLALLFRSRLTPSEVAYLAVPTLAVTAVLVWRTWTRRRGGSRERFRALWQLVFPFLLGALTPVILFILVYVISDAVDDLYRGLYVLPLRQIGVAKRHFPPLTTLVAAVPFGLLLAVADRISRRSGRVLTWTLVVLLGLLLLASRTDSVYRGVWDSARALPVVAALVGVSRIARGLQTGTMAAREQQELYLVLVMTALWSIVQFPFAAPIYFCYVAPFVALSLAAIVRAAPGVYYRPILTFYLVFALLRLNPGYISSLGVRFVPYRPLGRLELERGRLRVPLGDRRDYEDLMTAIQTRARGPYIYAAPDCPEVYFLSGRRNPTGVVFDFLRVPLGTKALLTLLEKKRINAVVENQTPDFSPLLSEDQRTALEQRFPRSQTIGRFVLRWRDSTSSSGEK
jgi:hypothetical protein